jgi:hypothetical protein
MVSSGSSSFVTEDEFVSFDSGSAVAWLMLETPPCWGTASALLWKVGAGAAFVWTW